MCVMGVIYQFSETEKFWNEVLGEKIKILSKGHTFNAAFLKCVTFDTRL